MRVCSACNAENPDGFRHCSNCGAPLGAPGVERRQLATLLFCDLSGSTALGERVDPESVKELLSSYFREMRGAVERHGGSVEKFIGDAVVAAFGVPAIHEDDALRACRAALEMQERMVALNDGLDERFGTRVAVRIGVNTGEVVTGGTMSQDTFVTGDAVNVAARLEQAAAPGDVLLGEPTFRLVRDAIRAEAIEPLNAKGKSRPVQAYRLLEITDPRSLPRRAGTPFAGREGQLRLLGRELESVVAGRCCRLVTVLGEPGVGKSRLVAEFVSRLEARARVVRGRCLPYGEGITFWAIGEIVRALAGIRDEHSVAQARALIEAQVSDRPDGVVVAAKVAQVLGLADGAATADESAWAIRIFLTARHGSEPLVVLIDDIHWAEPTLLDLLAGLPEAIADSPIMLLCPARPELLELRPRWDVTLRLEPLGAEDIDALLTGILGVAPAPVRERLAHVSAGNPLFVEELVAMLLEEGALRLENGVCILQGELAALALPASLHALLGARLGGLGAEERDLLERGAVQGELFHRAAIVELSLPDSRPSVPSSLDALSRKELVHHAESSFAGESAYRFKHILVRDTAYQATAKRLRSTLHEAYAGWLERAAGDRVTEYEEILGHHLEQSHRFRTELGILDDETRALGERAASRLAAAGRRAAERGDLGATVNLLGRAAALLPAQSAEQIELLLDLVDPLARLALFARAAEHIEQASAAIAVLGDERLAARVNIEVTWLAVFSQTGTFAETSALSPTEHAIPIFERLGDHIGLARAHELAAMVHNYFGRMSEVVATSERGLRYAERAHDLHQQGVHRMHRMLAAAWDFTPLERLEGLLEDDLVWARENGNLGVEAKATLRMSVVRGALGNPGERDDLFLRGMSSCTDLGMELWAAGFVGNWIWGLTDDAEIAETRLRTSCALLAGAGKRKVLSTVDTVLADALYRQGRYGEAEETLDAASRASDDDDVMTQVRLRAVRAMLLARRGHRRGAETLAREGVALGAGTEFVDLRGDSLLALGEVLRVAGRNDEAAAPIREAQGLWRAKGNLAREGATRALLTEL